MGLSQGFSSLVTGDVGAGRTLACFLPYGFSTQNVVRVGFRIMASLELSAEEQLSQGSQSAVCNIVSLISGENVLDNFGGGRDWQSIGVALQFNLFCHVLIFYSSSLFIALYLTIFMIMKKNPFWNIY